MLQLVGIPAILAAWTLPALFLLILAGLFTYAALRPVYVLWAAAVDTAAGWVSLRVAAMAEAVAERSHAVAVRHSSERGQT